MVSVLFFSFLVLLAQSQDPCKLNVNNIMNHLGKLDTIALANNNNRAAGTSGYAASVDYIVSTLQQNTNYQVTVQEFVYPRFSIIGTPRLSGTREYIYGTDFRVMSGSGTSFSASKAFKVLNQGCNDSDFVGFVEGSIVVVERGVCSFSEKAAKAEAFKASAIIIYNYAGQGSFSGSITSEIGALGVSSSLGLDLVTGTDVIFEVETKKENAVTSNVIADSITGDPSRVVLLGSHLDSVPAGAGINDNGSGSATNLEVALELFRCLPNPTNKLRFAFWGAEELGLLGSTHYVNDLVINNPQKLAQIALNINIDMLGSPNFFYGIYDGAGADPIIREKCIEIQNEFEGFIRARGQLYSLTPFDGRSDYGPFIAQGVPAGGLFSGAEVVKDATGRTKWGGLANTPFDPCYHAYCDTYENISYESLETLASAAFYVTSSYARDPTLQLSPIHNGTRYYIENMKVHPDAISLY